MTDEWKQAFREHVLREYPNEAAGLKINNTYYACTNIHPDPLHYFRIDGLERLELTLKHGPVEAVLHSHPYELKTSKQFVIQKYNPAWPSVGDQAAFMADDVDWYIVATDGEGLSAINVLTHEPQPLERRSFAWFTSDCYATCRDWHALNTGILLPNFTREWGFWERNINTIEDNMATLTNADKVPTEKAQIGDLAVMSLGGAKVVNHLGVLSGNNEFTHQFIERYCIVDRWDKWKHKAKYMIRFAK
jgi:cell wall-associated NlpC family hydrolase